jgi:hypothetical protein
MPLPHHRQNEIVPVFPRFLSAFFRSKPTMPIVRLWRWLARLPYRARCWISGHWWRPYDLLSDECACCGAKRTLPARRPR